MPPNSELSPQQRVDALKQYLEEHEVQLHKIDIRCGVRGSGDAVGVVALEDLAEDFVVCHIPKDAVLSRKTTAIGDLIEEHELGGGAAVALALMYERSQGEKSPFALYLASLPYSEPTLFAWTDEELELLRGTEPIEVVKQDKQLLEEDYETLVKPIMESRPDLFPSDSPHFTLAAWKAASSIVASRAFQVDALHGDSLIPLADAFNHKTDAEHVHLETDEVCPICGGAWPCEQHSLSDDEGEEVSDAGSWEDVAGDVEGEIEREEDEEPARPAKKAKVDGKEEVADSTDRPEQENGKNEDEDEDEAIGVLVDEDSGSEAESAGDDIMEMRLIRPVKAGEEIFNTYGEHSNASLLHKYGFVDDEPGTNQYDVVTIPLAIVREVAKTVFPGAESRIALWRLISDDLKGHFADDDDEDGIEDEEEDPESAFFRVAFDGTPENMLTAVLVVCDLDEKDIKGWKPGSKLSAKVKKSAVSAVLSGMKHGSAKVAEALVEVAKARLANYPTTLDEDRERYAKAKVQSREFQALTIRMSEKMALARMIALAASTKPKSNKRNRK